MSQYKVNGHCVFKTYEVRLYLALPLHMSVPFLTQERQLQTSQTECTKVTVKRVNLFLVLSTTSMEFIGDVEVNLTYSVPTLDCRE
jgi:hypothetical protein